jgi:translation initiation factor 2 alpha subunit (eIF-2alpha)
MAKVTIELDLQNTSEVIECYAMLKEVLDTRFHKIKEVKKMDQEGMKSVLHETRKEVDANIKKVEDLKKSSINQLAGRELALAYTKLQEAKMWLGKCLEMIGSELPKEFQDKVE